MKRFNVSMDNIEYLLCKEIKAETEDEAKEIYMQMWEEGNIEANKSELVNLKAEEIEIRHRFYKD